MSISTRDFNQHWKCKEQKQNFQTILVMTFRNFTMFQYRSHSPQVKQNVLSSTGNLVYKLHHELPNDLRLRILGNKEIIGKSQIWVGAQPSAQSLFQKFKFGNSSQKRCKSRDQTFLVQSSFTRFVFFSKYFVQDSRKTYYLYRYSWSKFRWIDRPQRQTD